MKTIIKNRSSGLNDTYRRKNNPNEYGNLVAFVPFDTSNFTVCSTPISKGVKPIVKRVRSPTMIIDKVTDYIGFRFFYGYLAYAAEQTASLICLVLECTNSPLRHLRDRT